MHGEQRWVCNCGGFNNPWGVALDGSGNAYVADSGNDTLRKVTPGGSVTTLAGTPGLAGAANGTGSNARFNDPQGVALDTMGISMSRIRGIAISAK